METRGTQITLAWQEAPDQIVARCEALRTGGSRPVIVGIAGPVGSGKTTLADRVGGSRLSTDDYLPDYASLPLAERDEPRHADLELLASHLESLGRGLPIYAPVWCFQEHRRTSVRRIEPAPRVVCEGIFALAPRVAAHLDLAIFVEAPREHRWARWERIERRGERGWGVEAAREYFERVAEPTFARHADAYRALANIIVHNPLVDDLESTSTAEDLSP